jgi:Flp pilus assembly pilin Flp
MVSMSVLTIFGIVTGTTIPHAFYIMSSLIRRTFSNFLQDEQGQDLIEYTLLLAFIALASASIFVSVGNSANTIWGAASTQLSTAALSAAAAS